MSENIQTENIQNNVKPPSKTGENIIKGLLYFLIFAIVGSIVYSFMAREAVKEEADTIILQINRSQDLYYSMAGRFHFTKKTSNDPVLGIDLSKNRFFTSFAIEPNAAGDGRYEIRLSGRTNPFSIVAHDIQTALNAKAINSFLITYSV